MSILQIRDRAAFPPGTAPVLMSQYTTSTWQEGETTVTTVFCFGRLVWKTWRYPSGLVISRRACW